MRVFTANLPFSTTADELRDLFSTYGTVEKATIATDRDTGRSRGFGFVEMADREALAAIEDLDGAPFGGREIKVEKAVERPRTHGGHDRSREGSREERSPRRSRRDD